MEKEDSGTIGELIGLLAHDVRNPLAALSSNVGFLSMVGTELSEDVRETLVDLQLSLEVLGRITDTMEVLSQELREQPTPALGRVSVSATIDGAWPQLERAAQSHGVRLAKSVESNLFASASEPSLSRALVHLVYNAISLAPARSAVELNVFSRSDSVVFQVKDAGPKLSPEFQSVAFTLSGQLKTKSKSEGRYSRGLGLYMVGRSASLAGGRVVLPENETGNVVELSFGVAAS